MASDEGTNIINFGKSWESPSNDSSYKAKVEKGSRMGQQGRDGDDDHDHGQDSGETTHEHSIDDEARVGASSLAEIGNSGGGIYRNPNRYNNNNNNNRSRADGNMNDHPSHDSNSSSNCCLSPWSLQSTLQVMDGVWIVCLIIYGCWTYHVLKQNHRNSSSSSKDRLIVNYVVLVIVILLTVSSTVRAVLMAMKEWCTCRQRQSRNILRRKTKGCPLWVSRITMSLCGLYGILALTTWIVVLVERRTGNNNNNNNNNTEHSWCTLNGWCHILYNPRAVPWVMTVWFVLEFLRSTTLFAQDDRHETTDPVASTRELHYLVNDDDNTPSRHRHRPWWWSRNSMGNMDDVDNINRRLDDPLLSGGRPGWATSSSTDDVGGDYSVDDGIGTLSSSPVTTTTTTTRRWGTSFGSFFATRQGRNRRYNTNDHIRDDGSVDYASLNEDWTSRAEEDPYWWTRN